MTLEYTEGGTVKFSMIDYINEIIAAFGKAYPRGSSINTSTEPEYLYTVDEEYKILSTEKAKIFHNLLAKNLYITKRTRPFTCTASDFLTTRVREHN